MNEKKDYKKLGAFKGWVLQNFPYIEEDFDALTNYELICKITDYINKIHYNQEALQENQIAVEDDFKTLSDFVNNYFANLDLQKEVDHKIDEMAEDGIFDEYVIKYVNPILEEQNKKIELQNTAIEEQNKKIAKSVGINPIPVESVDKMIDTNKIYVNTTDGNWYYFNSTTNAWEVGGIYQSTEVADGSITTSKVSFNKKGDNILNSGNYDYLEAYFYYSEPLTDQKNGATLYLQCKPNKSYEIYRKVSTERLMAGYTTETPALGVNVIVTDNNQSPKRNKTTVYTGEDAKFIVVYFKHPNDSLDRDEIAKNLVIIENGDDYDPNYYNLNITNLDLNNNSISAENTNFYKKSINEFDYKNCECIYINRQESPETFLLGNVTKYIIHKCEPNTTYTIYRDKVIGGRFGGCYSNEFPKPGVSYGGWKQNLTGKKFTITTGPEAQYLNIYYYNINIDGADVNDVDILNNIMIVKGNHNISKYIPPYIIDVQQENLDPSLNTLDKFSSRGKIFGVKFNNNSNLSAGTRICDAVGLQTDYVVNNIYQNGQKNDFDNIFPWCDIKLCNLTVKNGIKSITYYGENGFTLDGSNGNVMVEIPKFYSMREITGSDEIWAITGEPKSGFNVEPAFIHDGKEIDHVYVSAYYISNAINDNVYSYTKSNPMNKGGLYIDIDKFEQSEYTTYDFAIALMIQMLFTVEFANKDNKPYMQGVSELPFFYTGCTDFLIQEVLTDNQVVVKNEKALSNLIVGTYIGLGHTENVITDIRRITNIVDNENNTRTITYSGTELNLTALIDSLYAVGQFNGVCDDLIYHTGRRYTENGVSPFRYRYLENVWGNLWHRCGGLKLKNLEYYYSFDVNDYKKSVGDSTAKWKKLNYKAPNQPYLGYSKPWIVKAGYDVNDRRINLPILCGQNNGGGEGKGYSAGFYSYYDKTYNDTEIIDTNKEYTAAIGGCWDGFKTVSPFDTRLIIDQSSGYPDDRKWHYSNRIVYRK